MTGDKGDDLTQPPTETLGQALIAELAARKRRGSYLDYDGYQRLKTLKTAEDVQGLLDSQGLGSVRVIDDPVWIADGLEEAEEDKQPPEVLYQVLGPLAHLLWLLTRLRRKRRVFPNKKMNKKRYRVKSTSRRKP